MVEVEIESEKQNKLLNRREMSLIVSHQGEETPGREQLKDRVSNLVNSPKNTVIIDSINTMFGREQSTVEARVYDDEESAVKYERKYQKERNKIEG
ncbi:MAG: 30S ribosomal protein S24e [Thermoplasmatota archaeon]